MQLKKAVLNGLVTLGYKHLTLQDILYVLLNPVDAHAHLRRDEQAKFIAPFIKSQFTTAFFMPNVKITEAGDGDIGIRSYEKLRWYRNHVQPYLGGLQPLFSYYLSPDLSVEDIKRGWAEKLFSGIKYYPKGGTTGSEKGLAGFEAVHEQLSLMQELGIPFNVHGETPTLDGKTPVRGNQREGLFYENEGRQLREAYRGLRIVCEHITTKNAVDFVKKYENTFATITPQHFMLDDMALNHKAMINGEWYNYAIQLGFFPSMLCMPVLKDIEHVNALWDAILWQYDTQASKFFLGTDTAYHPHASKYSEGCSCGVFNSPVALEMYYMVFNLLTKRRPGLMSDFQRFCSDIGSRFYNIEAQPKKVVVIIKDATIIPKQYDEAVAPFAGEELAFKAVDVTNFV